MGVRDTPTSGGPLRPPFARPGSSFVTRARGMWALRWGKRVDVASALGLLMQKDLALKSPTHGDRTARRH